MHGHGVVALDEIGLPATALEEGLDLLVGDAGEDGRVADLVAVEVQNRQDGAVRHGVNELVGVPGRRERAGLGFAVAHNAGRNEVGVIEHRAEGVGQRVAELAALADGAGDLGRDVAGCAAGEGELADEFPQALVVLADVRIDLAVAAVEPVLGEHGVAAVTRAGNVDHVEVIFVDNAVEMRVNEVLSGHGAPVADDFFLDDILREGIAQERVVQKIELACGEVVRSTPPGVQRFELLGRDAPFFAADQIHVQAPFLSGFCLYAAGRDDGAVSPRKTFRFRSVEIVFPSIMLISQFAPIENLFFTKFSWDAFCPFGKD